MGDNTFKSLVVVMIVINLVGKTQRMKKTCYCDILRKSRNTVLYIP